MTAPTPDAVAQAREALRAHVCVPPRQPEDAFEWGVKFAHLEADLIAAVRAECAAKVRGIVEEMREQMLTGLPQFDGRTMCCDDCAHKLLNHLMAKQEAQP